MKKLDDMARATAKFHDKMKAFCDPLVQTFGVSHFFHAQVTDSGYFTGVNLNKAWEEYFFSDTSHVLVWPDKCHPCKVKSGVRLLQENNNEELSLLLSHAREKHSIHFSVQFVEKSNHDSNMYGFALNSSDPVQHMVLLKEMPLLRLFIKRFHEEFKELYDALDDNKIDMETLLGSSFRKVNHSEISKSVMRDQFLKKMGIEMPVPLTDREIDVIKYLVKSCSAVEIGSELFLSKRTIEHHIERIKEKFDASSKSELVQKILELRSIGYLTF